MIRHEIIQRIADAHGMKEQIVRSVIEQFINSQSENEQETFPNGTIVPFLVNGVAFNMISVEGGTFMMGSEDDDNEADAKEKPRHSVTVGNFYIGQTVVTQGLWKAIMGNNPSPVQTGDNYPVEQVSWEDCQVFLRRLNEATGMKFRLPTEAEWEYAARGGNESRGYKYSGSNIIGEVAWYRYNSENELHPVAHKRANELGVYDMSGNVFEWCQDCYGKYPNHEPTDDSFRVGRGGSWRHEAGECRVTDRPYGEPTQRYANLGLRLAL